MKKKYSSQRNDLYNFIKENCYLITDDFSVNQFLNQESKFIRACYFVDEHLEDEIKSRIKNLETLFFEEFKEAKKLPLNFPKIYTEIENVFLSKNDAYFSILLDEKDESLKGTYLDFCIAFNYLKNSVDINNNFFKQNNLKFESFEINNRIIYKINAFDLLKFLKAKKVRYRVNSGSRYIARVSNIYDESIKTTYSFMLFLKNKPKIHQVLPRKNRNDIKRLNNPPLEFNVENLLPEIYIIS